MDDDYDDDNWEELGEEVLEEDDDYDMDQTDNDFSKNW